MADETATEHVPDRQGHYWFQYVGPHETVLVDHGNLEPGQKFAADEDLARRLRPREDMKPIARPSSKSTS